MLFFRNLWSLTMIDLTNLGAAVDAAAARIQALDASVAPLAAQVAQLQADQSADQAAVDAQADRLTAASQPQA